ncbi:MAG TPA: hypothetical protein VGB51_01100 [Actinomycetota bacterium]
MRSRLTTVMLPGLLLLAGIIPPAAARTSATSDAIPCPAGAVSANVECIATISDLRGAIAVNFIGDTMFVSRQIGLSAYDISDPSTPELLGVLPMYLWENEDMDVDPVRKRVFLSRDPRGFTTSATSGATFPYGAVHIIDASNPHALVQVGFFLVPAGHTSTCINSCDFLWTGGPYANAQTQPGYTGRPIYATDVRDPANPVACPQPIDLGRDDGVTNYAHDVQVDADGIAWVSGDGGVRGYWTTGTHRNPLTGEMATATGCSPIPYGGGGTPYAGEGASGGTYSKFMHNAWRNPSANIPDEDDPETPEDETLGHVLYGTEENITSNCAQSGRFATYDLRGSYEGEGWRSTPTAKFRMRVLDTWTPQGAEGSTGCASAHYMADRGDGVLAYAFYGQGTRFLDVSNPKDITQIGYYRPNGASTWAPYWHNGEVYIADNSRGVDIIRFTGEAGDPASSAPLIPASQVAQPFEMSKTFAYLCPVAAEGLRIG